MRGLVLFIAALAGVVGLGITFHPDVTQLLSQVNVSFATAFGSAHAPAPSTTAARACPTDPLAPAVTPKLAFDNQPNADGLPARYGTLQYPRGPIAPMQIAITFDDGPDPVSHTRVLDILDKHCLKATFFFVGQLAAFRPEMVRDTAARGHTIGTHSWSHPDNMRRLSSDGQIYQISEGIVASQKALASATPQQQQALAPFFRFPGLNDSRAMLAYLGQHKIAVFSSDFGADDWKGISSAEIERRALREGAESHGGVLILHESRIHTVQALDDLITAFERRGYTFVQLVPKAGARELAASADGALVAPASGAKTPG